MKRRRNDSEGVMPRACLVAVFMSGLAMPASADGRVSDADTGMPALPCSMTLTKLPDKHIPDDVATYDSPLSTVVMDGEFWVMNHDAWRYKGQPVLRYKGTNFDDLVSQVL